MRSSLLLLLLTTLAFAQGRSATSPATPDQNGTEPELPVIDENACPFEGCTFKEWKVTKESPLYSTWQDSRTQIGKLNAGERVLGLTGTHITRRPDRILVKRAISELSLNSGDIILRYMYVGEGFANIWAKGVWHKEYDCSFIYEGVRVGMCQELRRRSHRDGTQGMVGEG